MGQDRAIIEVYGDNETITDSDCFGMFAAGWLWRPLPQHGGSKDDLRVDSAIAWNR